MFITLFDSKAVLIHLIYPSGTCTNWIHNENERLPVFHMTSGSKSEQESFKIDSTVNVKNLTVLT